VGSHKVPRWPAVGAGLAVTLVGIPILTLVLASVRPLLAAAGWISEGLAAMSRGLARWGTK
jgi:hypothetical protein